MRRGVRARFVFSPCLLPPKLQFGLGGRWAHAEIPTVIGAQHSLGGALLGGRRNILPSNPASVGKLCGTVDSTAGECIRAISLWPAPQPSSPAERRHQPRRRQNKTPPVVVASIMYIIIV